MLNATTLKERTYAVQRIMMGRTAKSVRCFYIKKRGSLIAGFIFFTPLKIMDYEYLHPAQESQEGQPTALQRLEQMVKLAQTSVPTDSGLRVPDQAQTSPVTGGLPVVEPSDYRITGKPVMEVTPDMLRSEPTARPRSRQSAIEAAQERYRQQKEIAKLLPWPPTVEESADDPDFFRPRVEMSKTAVSLAPKQPAPARIPMPPLQLRGEQGALLAGQASQAYDAAEKALGRQREHAGLYQMLRYAGQAALAELRQQGHYYSSVEKARQGLEAELQRDAYYFQMYKNLGDLAVQAATGEHLLQRAQMLALHQAAGIVHTMVTLHRDIEQRHDDYWTTRPGFGSVTADTTRRKAA